VRIEAGAYRGKPVFFRCVDPWDRPWLMEEYDPGRAQRYFAVFGAVVVLAMMAGALLLARRNLRLGRGDRKGATRLALFVVVALMLSWAIGASHAPDVNVELARLTMALGYSLAWGVLTWLAYLALEPFLRRRWPDTMISWNRLLAGRFRDPRIGRDLLVGVTAFWAWMLVATIGTLAPGWFGLPPPRPMWEGSLSDLLAGRYVAASLIDALLLSVLITMGVLFFLLLLRVILRKQWLAVVVMLLLAATPTAVFLGPSYLLVYFPLQLIFWSCFFLLLTRFGLLSICSFWVCTALISSTVTYDVTQWYGVSSIVYLLAIFALAGYGFVTALAGRPLLHQGVVPED
jgi:serine/threonine-protein kinase